MKKLWSIAKTGLSVLLPIFIFLSFLGWLYGTLVSVSYGHIGIAIAVVATSIMLVGWLASQRWFRGMVIRFCKDIPFVSTIVNFLLNHDYVEQMKSGNLMREAMWEIAKDVWIFGVVVSRHKMPKYPDLPESPLIDWVEVLVPTTPILFTGHLLLVPEYQIIYTGRNSTDTTLTAASFGFNMRLDHTKFQRVTLEDKKK